MISVRTLSLGTCALGRAIDAQGDPLDGGPRLCGRQVPLESPAPRPGERARISSPLWTGVRVLDALLTLGRGARLGIFGPPGAGKSTLVESIVGGCGADAVVVALIGERGREAQRWIEMRDDRTTVVCATSDRPARERMVAARVALAHARALRERGLHVLLVLDSLARVATAARELAIAAGERFGRGGYPPSVFSQLARLIEVPGELASGSITLLATVLVDAEDRDPIGEAARSMLDGHVTLALRLAETGRFPAVDVPASTSRTMDCVVDAPHRTAAGVLRGAIAALDRVDDARSLGIEPSGALVKSAIAVESRLEAFLRQDRAPCDPRATIAELLALGKLLGAHPASR